MFNLFKKFKKSKPGWKKVKDLSPGMRIAVPRAGLLADHLQSRDGMALNAGQGREPDVQWDEIVAIKPLGREQVYDIEVAGSHNFVANNIFAHNTYISGNVGIGSSTPSYKLAVEGEVAAQAFVNISTAAEKKDIKYLGADDDSRILEKIRATNVATYQYKNDPSVASTPHLMWGRGPLYGEPATGATKYKGSLTPFASGYGDSGQQEGDLTGGKRLGLIAENAPAEVLAAGGKGVDLYKLGTFVLAGLKAESRARETGVLALDTRIAAEMASLKEGLTTKRLSVLGSANGDLLYIATGEASVASTPPFAKGGGRGPLYTDSATGAAMYKGSLGSASGQQEGEPIFRITAEGEVVVRDDIVFSPKQTVISLPGVSSVVALSSDEAEMYLRPAYKGAVIVAIASDGAHIFNPKTHKEISGYVYNNGKILGDSVIASNGNLPLVPPLVRGGDGGVLPKHITADYFTQPFDENTLGQWPFKTLADATGNGNDLSMTGNVSLAAEGVRGTAASFDGAGYLTVASTPPFAKGGGRGPLYSESATGTTMYKGSLTPSASGYGGSGQQEGGSGQQGSGTAMTLGAWVKFNSLSSNQTIISQDGVFSLKLGDAGYAEVTVQGVSKVATRKSLAALDNDWHYVAASYSALKARLDVYIDGALTNGELAGEIPLTGLGLSNEPVKLGAGFYGTMDDAFLSATDVAEYPPLGSGGSYSYPPLGSGGSYSYPPLAKGGTKGGLSPEDIRSNYLIGRKALNYGLAATSGLQATPTSAAIDEVNNMLYVGTASGEIITVDLSADAVAGRQTVPVASSVVVSTPHLRGRDPLYAGQPDGQPNISGSSPASSLSRADARDAGSEQQERSITSLAVSSGAGRTLAAIIGNQLWLDTETISMRDALAKAQIQGEGIYSSVPSPFQGEGIYSSVPSPFQGEGRVRVGEGGRRALTVFEDLLITGGKILPEASSGLPLFAITSDGVVEGLAFRDVSFVNELVNASFEYWDNGLPVGWSSVASTPSAVVSSEARNPLYSDNSVGQPSISGSSPASAGSEQQGGGSGQQKDAKFGSSSVQITGGVLSATLPHSSDFASSTVTLSAWVKTDKMDDVKLVIASASTPPQSPPYQGGEQGGVILAQSSFHTGSGRWERLIVTAKIPASVGTRHALSLQGGVSTEAGIQIQITSASKTALVDGVMFQRGALPTAFVPSIGDTILANPQYLNFTAEIAAASSSPSSAGPTEGLLAKLPAGTFKNTIRIDQLSVGLDKDAAATFTVISSGARDPEDSAMGSIITCTTTGSSCRASGSLTVSPSQELLIKYSVQGDADAKATVNLRYYPEP